MKIDKLSLVVFAQVALLLAAILGTMALIGLAGNNI